MFGVQAVQRKSRAVVVLLFACVWLFLLVLDRFRKQKQKSENGPSFHPKERLDDRHETKQWKRVEIWMTQNKCAHCFAVVLPASFTTSPVYLRSPLMFTCGNCCNFLAVSMLNLGVSSRCRLPAPRPVHAQWPENQHVTPLSTVSVFMLLAWLLPQQLLLL